MVDLSELQEEFLRDHRVLTKGLDAILDALQDGRTTEAIERAADLDRQAGAHMAFEEEIFYPRLAEVRGQKFVDRLVAEHEVGQRAIRALARHPAAEPLAEEDRKRIVADVETALGHVLSCGTMLSELDSGDEIADDRALGRLRELRTSGERWTDRSYRSH